MKRVTDFIVSKRNFIFVFFLIISIWCLFLAGNVKINRDIAKYLPSSSKVRQGMDIMEDEFGELNNSNLNIMFKNLTKKEKKSITNYLDNLEHVEGITTQNKKNYTLYEIETDLQADSSKAMTFYNKIIKKYRKYDIALSGTLDDENKDVLPAWIVALAIGCALIILMIMCESYIEPFLFLIAIYMAVIINKGTSIMFPMISSITNSITAILQLALSMDYSIMLINRYRQEKKQTKDNVEAMKKALYASFKSISSSSVTTVVGLLALVFMSFGIGRDLGFILAKGVLLSLVTIFTCLPALILMFDKLIRKTKKKTPVIKLDCLGRFMHKFRYFGIGLFIIIFGASFVLKGSVDILYTDKETDEVSKVFTTNNQMAIIYNSKYEKEMTKLCQKLAKDKKINEVLCYGNTLNEKLTYENLNPKLTDLGNETNIEDYLLKIVYYNYYNEKNNLKISFNDFLNFIQKEVYSNPDLAKEVDSKTRNNIERVANFTDPNKMNIKHSAQEIAQMFELDEKTVNDLLIYYQSLNNQNKLTLNQYVSFIQNNVVNSSYGQNIPQDTLNELKTITPYLDKEKLNQELTYEQMANFLQTDPAILQQLYTYYNLNQENLNELSINDFTSFALTIDELPAESKELLTSLQTFSNKEIISNKLTYQQASAILGIDPQLGYTIYYLAYLQESPDIPLTEYKLFLNELIPFMLNHPFIKSAMDEETIAKLNLVTKVMESTLNNETFTYSELSELLNYDESTIKSVYSLYFTNNTTMNIKEFLDFVIAHQNDEVLKGKLDGNTLNRLEKLLKIVNSVLNNQSYTSLEISSFLGGNEEYNKLLYALYDTEYLHNNVNLSYQEFVAFLLNNVVPNPTYNTAISEDTIQKLNTLQQIMTDSNRQVKYSQEQLSSIISKLQTDSEEDLISLVYLYYGSINAYDSSWSLTVEEFVNYLNDVILTDTRFDRFIDKQMHNDIEKAQEKVQDAKELLVGSKHNRLVINANLDKESKETFAFIKNIKKELKNDDIYLIGNSAMAEEMSETFQGELNYITILTIAFIFVVVMFTFRSFLIPLTLVILIQTAVYLTMGVLAFEGGTIYFIALLIVQSILMGATIDYAILYTSYYLEGRKKLSVKDAIINAYNNSIHTILTSASILSLVTLVVGYFGSAIASKICITISQGTIMSTLLILFILPALIASFDKFIIRQK